MNANCHPERPTQARGLCRACYMKFWRNEDPSLIELVSAHDEKKPRSRKCVPLVSNTPNWPAIVTTLKRARRSRKLSQPALAEIVGVNNHTLWRWENQHAMPSFGMFLRWCEKLGCSMNFGVKEIQTPPSLRHVLRWADGVKLDVDSKKGRVWS